MFDAQELQKKNLQYIQQKLQNFGWIFCAQGKVWGGNAVIKSEWMTLYCLFKSQRLTSCFLHTREQACKLGAKNQLIRLW